MQTKTIVIENFQVDLYSLDGRTWASRITDAKDFQQRVDSELHVFNLAAHRLATAADKKKSGRRKHESAL